MIEKLLRFRLPFIFVWQKRENMFGLANNLFFLTLAFLVHLKLIDEIKEISPIIVLPLITTFLYVLYSLNPKGTKETKIILRIFFLVQIFMFTLKVDGRLEWNWLSTVWLVLLIFGFSGVSCLIHGLILIFGLARCFRDPIYPGMRSFTQFIGVVWSFMIAGMSIIVLCGYIKASISDFDNLQTDFIRNCAKVGQALCIFVIVQTFLFRKTLAKFNEYFARADIRSIIQNQIAPEPEKVVILNEKVKTYLLMISSTYFIELKNGFKLQSSERLAKIKENTQRQRSRSRVVRRASNSPLIASQNINDLKKEKEILDKKLSPFIKLENNPSMIGREMKAKNIVDNNNLTLQHELSIKEDLNIMKHCLSEGASIFASEMGQSEENENGQCYVCFDNEANAVMMDCGHGGVCYDCATEFLLKKRECMECRGKVNRLIKLNGRPQLKNIVISHELGKLISEKPTLQI